jgi:CRP/FNR family transcriptional regulator, cyclic AMP receptor protein
LHFLKLKEQSHGVGCVATGTLQSGNDFALVSNDLFDSGDMTADHGQMVQNCISVHVSHDSRSLLVGLAFALPVWRNATRDRRGLAVAKKSKSQFDPRAFLAKGDGGVTVSIYRRGQIVFTQGDPADCLFFIQEGKVKVTVVSQQGKEAVIAFLEAGDFIGEGCLTGRLRRVSTARTLTDCIVTRLDKSTMVRMLRGEPNFSELFTAHLLSRTLRTEEDLVDQLFNSSEKRLARALLLLANFGKDGKHEPVIAKVSQETLADMIGTTRSRVSHFMNKFRELGYINYNGDLEVHSSLLDAVLHEKPQIKAPK